MTLVAKPFTVLANIERKALGLDELPYVVVPYPMSAVPPGEAARRALAVREQVFAALTTAPGQAAATPGPQARTSDSLTVALADGSFDAVNRAFEAWHWTDGLPVVPPTAARVAAMLAYSDLRPEQVLGRMGTSWAGTSVFHVAVNAVMAGCRPEYFPVVLTAIQAALEEEFNLNGTQATTNPAGVMLVVNGPVARELDINGGANVFGQGWHANGTIGRAVRLCLINIGNCRPLQGDMATLGNPNKWGACIAENEAASPWPPLHVRRGHEAGTSTVTVVAAVAPTNLLTMSPDPVEIMTGMCHALSGFGTNGSYFDSEVLIVIGPLQASQFAEAGWDIPAIRRWLWEHATFDIAAHHERAQTAIRGWKQRMIRIEGNSEIVHPTATPEEIVVMVAGAESGPHSAVVNTFNGTRIVTRAIARADGTPVGSVRDFLQ